MLPLPWGNMRLVSDPCRQWAVFRMLTAPEATGATAQLSVLREEGGAAHLYSCLSLRTRDAAGNTTTATAITVTVINQSGSGVQLLGLNTVSGSSDSNPAGDAEAFKYTATASGAAASVKFYVTSGSTLKVGIYSDNNNHPGTLLASGSATGLTANNWNTVTLTASPNISVCPAPCRLGTNSPRTRTTFPTQSSGLMIRRCPSASQCAKTIGSFLTSIGGLSSCLTGSS